MNGRCGMCMYFPISVWLLVVVMMNLQISRDLIFESYLLFVGQFGTLSSKRLACVKDLVKVSDNLYIVVVVVDIFLWTTVKFVVVCVDCVKWSRKMPYKDELKCCLHSVVLVIASCNCS